MTIALPKAVTEQTLGAEANGTLLVGDRTVIASATGGFAGIANAGPILTNVGANSQVGNVVSVAAVTLASGATVHGYVQTSLAVAQQGGVTVTGGTQTGAVLTPPDQLSWQVSFPLGSGSSVDVEPGHTTTLAPGNYGLVSVEPGATLSLSAGTYFIDTLNVALGATVAAHTSAGPAVVYLRSNLVDLGSVTDTGGGSNLLVAYLGLLPISVPGSFAGTLVAPSALLTVGPSALAGAFFAQNLTVVTGTTITVRPFVGWGSLGACEALTPSEKTAATQLGLDPTAVYSVAGNEQQMTVPVAPGGKITLGLRYESGTGPEDSSARFRVLSLDNGAVLGGSTFVVRRH